MTTKGTRLKGEAYFLRAFTYHDLLRFYGTKKLAAKEVFPLFQKR
jgi:hypothetical protein